MIGVTPDTSETERLLKQADGGDRRAIERLLDKHRSDLRQVVAMRLDPRTAARVDPSDIVQETQLEALRRLPDYLARRPMPFRLWLIKTAHERLIVARRRHVEAARRAVGREEPLPDHSSLLVARRLFASGASPSQQLNERELAERVQMAVSQLPEGDREILFLRTFEGLSNHEAAIVLDLDPGTASKRHGRAILRLHQILKADGLTESQS
jgi:RNA polymerase sigma-70 factor (ECF subfamily)